MKNERETAMKSQNSEKSDGCHQPQILRWYQKLESKNVEVFLYILRHNSGQYVIAV